MKPSPPNRPVITRRWNWTPIDTPLAAARKLSFWQISRPPMSPSLSGRIAPGRGRGEGDARLAVAVVGEDGREQALARHQPAARAEQLAHEASVGAAAAVAEHGRHADAAVLPDERAGLRDRALARIELDLEELELMALHLEVDVVGDAGLAAMLPWVWVGHAVLLRSATG
jgi:hypothetical protein